eukprot:9568699-Ditylum_brightwellii.AAC.1
MIHIPNAAQTFDQDGKILNEKEEEEIRWNGYMERCWNQLEWWGEACQKQKLVRDPYVGSPVLKKDPKERNAPSSSSSS